jgi:hypothetical protein
MRAFSLGYDCTHYDKNGKVIKITTAIEAEARRWRAEFGDEFTSKEKVQRLTGVTVEAKEVKCVVCDTKFYSPYKNAAFCGDRCRSKRKKPKSILLPKRNCRTCSREFQPSRSNNHFCNYNSRKCIDIHIRAKQKETRDRLKKEQTLDDE